ncbi:hypothetical protein ACQF36_22670 [Streptomyces sp. Marseille-Q5077]|uniref:hypothetical protein n=1 Tax=Streptomyces sp. Marseille-Q5077 TaxID=3418995 RepID=UPI003D053CCE
MLFKLTGSSCSGKTTLACAAADRLRNIVVHDFDELGVPEGADRRWRHRMTEMWLRRALEYQDRGIDLLFTGQSPLGEVLATPSAPLLDGIAICLVDVADEVRRARLAERDPGRWETQAVDAFLGWAEWHRNHALDPRHRPRVIVDWSGTAGPDGMPMTPDGARSYSTPRTDQSPNPWIRSSSGSRSSAKHTGPANSP